MQFLTKRLFSTSKHFIDLELKYGCHNYAPLHAVIDRAEGIYMWDCEGKLNLISRKEIY
jgi:ornithine--oxo-acid transaminase